LLSNVIELRFHMIVNILTTGNLMYGHFQHYIVLPNIHMQSHPFTHFQNINTDDHILNHVIYVTKNKQCYVGVLFTRMDLPEIFIKTHLIR